MTNSMSGFVPLDCEAPAQPIFEHIHKNLWLVGNWAGVHAAAKVVTRQNGKKSSEVHVVSNRMQISGKYPCIIVLVQVHDAMAEVMSVITDTTLKHCLISMEALPK